MRGRSARIKHRTLNSCDCMTMIIGRRLGRQNRLIHKYRNTGSMSKRGSVIAMCSMFNLCLPCSVAFLLLANQELAEPCSNENSRRVSYLSAHSIVMQYSCACLAGAYVVCHPRAFPARERSCIRVTRRLSGGCVRREASGPSIQPAALSMGWSLGLDLDTVVVDSDLSRKTVQHARGLAMGDGTHLSSTAMDIALPRLSAGLKSLLAVLS